jgi:hypothetical protein
MVQEKEGALDRTQPPVIQTARPLDSDNDAVGSSGNDYLMLWLRLGDVRAGVAWAVYVCAVAQGGWEG